MWSHAKLRAESENGHEKWLFCAQSGEKMQNGHEIV